MGAGLPAPFEQMPADYPPSKAGKLEGLRRLTNEDLRDLSDGELLQGRRHG